MNPHIYHLPNILADGKGWTFDPGEVLYLITGHEADALKQKLVPL